MTSRNSLQIERLASEHLEETFRLFYEGFQSKFKAIFNMPLDKRLAVLNMFWQQNLSNPHDRQFQVKRDGRIVAVFGLTFGLKQAVVEAPKPISWFSILCEAGLMNYLKIRRIFQLFGYIPENNTAYLSYLCVDQSLRGSGIGNEILDWITEYLQKDPAIYKISLFVAEDNLKARMLYLKRGSSDVEYETSRSTLKYMGIYGWYYMEAPIKLE